MRVQLVTCLVNWREDDSKLDRSRRDSLCFYASTTNLCGRVTSHGDLFSVPVPGYCLLVYVLLRCTESLLAVSTRRPAFFQDQMRHFK